MRALFIASGIFAGIFSAQNPEDFAAGYYVGYDDAVALMSEALTMIDNNERAGNYTMTASDYKRLYRDMVDHMGNNPRNNPRVKKLLEMR